MAITIDHVCDMTGKREPVKLPKSGPLDLSLVKLPEGWGTRPSVPGAGPQDEPELTLCPEALVAYDQAVKDAEEAVKGVFIAAFNRATSSMRKATGQVVAAAPTGPHRSSSFNSQY